MSTDRAGLPVTARQLLDELARLSQLHLAEIASELQQTNLLLHEAIGKLTASFSTVHEAVQAQQQISAASDAREAEMRELSERVSRAIEGAVTGLQFQDLTSQLIERSLSRVAGLQEMLSGVDELANASGATDLQALLARRNGLLDSRPKSVRQNHMESGDIELF